MKEGSQRLARVRSISMNVALGDDGLPLNASRTWLGTVPNGAASPNNPDIAWMQDRTSSLAN